MSVRAWSVWSSALCALVSGCAPIADGEGPGAGSDAAGRAVAQIAVVPAGTGCIALSMTRGATTSWRGFEVVPAQRATLDLGRLSPGAMTVRAWAMNQDCDKFGVDDGPSVTRLNDEAGWISEAAEVTVTQTGHTAIYLTLRRNGSAGATLDFLPAEGVAEVFSGYMANSTYARMADGSVWAWGFNGARQLGDGSITDRFYPVRSSLPIGRGRIAAGANVACALDDEGVMRCAGRGTSPFAMGGDLRFRSVQADGIMAGVTSDFEIWREDGSSFGLGLSRPQPDASASGLALVDSLSRVVGASLPTGCGAGGASINGPYTLTALGAGHTAVTRGLSHLCALRIDGQVGCCGANARGQLGDPTLAATATVNTLVRGLTNARAIASGAAHTCALASDGGVWCWGANTVGQLGRGNIADSPFAQRVPGLANVTHLAAGAEHTCARTSNGQVYCWGGNTYGQLGDGSISPRFTPVLVGR